MIQEPPPPAAPPFPTAGTAVNRLVGRYAIVTMGSLVLTCFEWEIEIRADFVDGTAHGDPWDVPVPLKYEWTGRARGYYHIGDATYLAAYAAQISGTPPPDLAAITFTGYRTFDGTTAANPIFTASGFVTRSRWLAPEAMAEQEIEMRGTGLPSAIA